MSTFNTCSSTQVCFGVFPCSVLLCGIVLGPPADLRGPRGGGRAGGGWGQFHPAGPTGQRVALVQSADSVVLVVDVVGDVLQILEVGAWRRAAGQPRPAMANPRPPAAPWAPCTLTG